MPNESNRWPDKKLIRENYSISASMINQIVAALSRRIVGDGKTVNVRTFPGGQLVIESINGTAAKKTKNAEVVIDVVARLPPIPEKGMREVFWVGPQTQAKDPNKPDTALPINGNGDHQVWRAFAAQSHWTPTQRATNLVGTPGTGVVAS